jgi:hypothetical protein
MRDNQSDNGSSMSRQSQALSISAELNDCSVSGQINRNSQNVLFALQSGNVDTLALESSRQKVPV